MNYLDLFHGIGGFALGAYWASMKFENHLCSDIEKYPVELYKKRFPDSIQLGDITKIDFEKLKNDYPGAWIITGGFPCQDISVAGKGKGLIDEKGNKTRSGLWFEMLKGIRILRPRFVFIENVRALLSRGMETVLANLADIGYNAEWQVVSAADMGAPHRRERVWIVAYSGCWKQRQSSNSNKMYTEWNCGKNTANKISGSSSHGCSKKMADPSSRRFKSSESKDQSAGRISSKSKQISNSQGQGRECREARKQGKQAQCRKEVFGWSDSGSRENYWKVEPAVGRLVNGLSGRVDRLKGLGNSIVPQIAEVLFRQIKQYM